jgi:anaerobic magnesium-protoporphyrin IX monomethyl ester cyclase
MLVAGGPLPTSNPLDFLDDFDVVVVGEGEQTLVDLVNSVERGVDLSAVKGIVYREKAKREVVFNVSREFIQDLDSVPFPARDLFNNEAYKDYYSKSFGYTITSMITSRGCPFNCDFCSRPIFGNGFKARSAVNVVDEVESILPLKYDRIWFADDCFTLDRKRLMGICDEMLRRRLRIGWECLSRVDTIDKEVAKKMRKAGCVRVFFGIESGNDKVLALMKKQVTIDQARRAVDVAKHVGLQVGAFFILGYPGEDDGTVLDTVRFASSLPLDYLSFTFPYPIPGTALYERVKDRIIVDDWEEPKNLRLIKHGLSYCSAFSDAKLKFAIVKATFQFYVRKYLGADAYRLVGMPFEQGTDFVFRKLH